MTNLMIDNRDNKIGAVLQFLSGNLNCLVVGYNKMKVFGFIRIF